MALRKLPADHRVGLMHVAEMLVLAMVYIYCLMCSKFKASHQGMGCGFRLGYDLLVQYLVLTCYRCATNIKANYVCEIGILMRARVSLLVGG
jgi:hypothetical protein